MHFMMRYSTRYKMIHYNTVPYYILYCNMRLPYSSVAALTSLSQLFTHPPLAETIAKQREGESERQRERERERERNKQQKRRPTYRERMGQRDTQTDKEKERETKTGKHRENEEIVLKATNN